MNFERTLVAFAIAGVMLAGATTARAQTTCGGTMLNDAGANFTATPIYISGSTALEPMIKVIGPKLAQQTNPYVIIYLSDGSCAGVNRINSDGKLAAGTTMKYIPPDYVSTKTYNCNIAAGGQVGDLVLSDVDATMCPGISAQPANTKDYQGPVNSMVLVAPSTSTQTAISAEDAYLMFGMGANGMVSPWLDPMFYFIRTPDSGTRTMINANIGVGAHAWQGQDGTAGGGKAFGSGDVLNHVAANAQTAADKTIGILGADYWDSGTNRSTVKALAFRAFKQHYAYLARLDGDLARSQKRPRWPLRHLGLRPHAPADDRHHAGFDRRQVLRRSGAGHADAGAELRRHRRDRRFAPDADLRDERHARHRRRADEAVLGSGAVRLLLREPRHRRGSRELHRVHRHRSGHLHQRNVPQGFL